MQESNTQNQASAAKFHEIILSLMWLKKDFRQALEINNFK